GTGHGDLASGVVHGDCPVLLVDAAVFDVEVGPVVTQSRQDVQVLFHRHAGAPAGASDRSPKPYALPGPIPCSRASRRRMGSTTRSIPSKTTAAKVRRWGCVDPGSTRVPVTFPPGRARSAGTSGYVATDRISKPADWALRRSHATWVASSRSSTR